ncbi:MAG TPA: antibiotic biosynthesis monooxygenase [Anaerolineales bacterium]|nr:antibiotic biosynthesis monooxygenase [Anaerolineales bacterium]
MIQIVWQYEVKEGCRSAFELAYGPGGAWSSLFGKCPGFRGTALLRDTSNPCRYLAVDSWDNEEDRQAMLAENREEHSALDSSFREWTESETRLGVFRLLAEATVRPGGNARHRVHGRRR